MFAWWFFVLSARPHARDRCEKSGASSSRTAGKPRAVPASRAIHAAESALVGEEVETVAVWSEDQNQAMVCYYDVQAANAEGLTKEQTEAACAENQDLDP